MDRSVWGRLPARGGVGEALTFMHDDRVISSEAESGDRSGFYGGVAARFRGPCYFVAR